MLDVVVANIRAFLAGKPQNVVNTRKTALPAVRNA
jgi:hypothetical protein